jgi:hypothetical protein
VWLLPWPVREKTLEPHSSPQAVAMKRYRETNPIIQDRCGALLLLLPLLLLLLLLLPLLLLLLLMALMVLMVLVVSIM